VLYGYRDKKHHKSYFRESHPKANNKPKTEPDAPMVINEGESKNIFFISIIAGALNDPRFSSLK